MWHILYSALSNILLCKLIIKCLELKNWLFSACVVHCQCVHDDCNEQYFATLIRSFRRTVMFYGRLLFDMFANNCSPDSSISEYNTMRVWRPDCRGQNHHMQALLELNYKYLCVITVDCKHKNTTRNHVSPVQICFCQNFVKFRPILIICVGLCWCCCSRLLGSTYFRIVLHFSVFAQSYSVLASFVQRLLLTVLLLFLLASFYSYFLLVFWSCADAYCHSV